MLRQSLVYEKSFSFALEIVRLSQILVAEKKEFILSKQLVRSGTSVGAMIREAEHAESRDDFKHKLAIAQKEMSETLYWLQLLVATDYLTKEQFESIQPLAVEVMKLLTAILKTTKRNMQ